MKELRFTISLIGCCKDKKHNVREDLRRTAVLLYRAVSGLFPLQK